MLNSKNNVYKKCLASVLSITLLSTTISETVYCKNSATETNYADNFFFDKNSNHNDDLHQLNKNAMPNNSYLNKKMQKIEEFSKKHWILSGIFRICLFEVSFSYILLGFKTALYKYGVKLVENDLKEKFNTKNNIYTKKQEGSGWCWLTCLQGIYKYYGIEISQKEIFKKLTNVSPSFFEVERDQGLPAYCMFGKNFINEINNLNEKLKFNITFVHLNDCKNEKLIKKCIIDYYNTISKKPFAIMDSFALSKGCYHMMNIVKIDNEKVTIEDPQTGLSRVEDLTNYSKRYIGLTHIVEMYTVVPQEVNIKSEKHYLLDSKTQYDDEVKNFSCCN